MVHMTKRGGAMGSGSAPVTARVHGGDRLVVRAHRQGAPQRDAEILEVLGEDGGPPFRVRWSDDGHETIVYPGSDAYIERLVPTRRARRQETHR
jgi:hypothetical protein